MLLFEKAIAERYRSMNFSATVLFSALKIGVAYAVITYFDYGLLVVIGYLLYSVESIAVRQFVNAHETNYHLNVLHQKPDDNLSSEMREQIKAMKERIEELEETVELLT